MRGDCMSGTCKQRIGRADNDAHSRMAADFERSTQLARPPLPRRAQSRRVGPWALFVRNYCRFGPGQSAHAACRRPSQTQWQPPATAEPRARPGPLYMCLIEKRRCPSHSNACCSGSSALPARQAAPWSRLGRRAARRTTRPAAAMIAKISSMSGGRAASMRAVARRVRGSSTRAWSAASSLRAARRTP